MKIKDEELYEYLKRLAGAISSFDSRVTDQQNKIIKVMQAIENLEESVNDLKSYIKGPASCYVELDEDGNPVCVCAKKKDVKKGSESVKVPFKN